MMEREGPGVSTGGSIHRRIDLSQEGLESQELAEPFLDRVRGELGAHPRV